MRGLNTADAHSAACTQGLGCVCPLWHAMCCMLCMHAVLFQYVFGRLNYRCPQKALTQPDSLADIVQCAEGRVSNVKAAGNALQSQPLRSTWGVRCCKLTACSCRALFASRRPHCDWLWGSHAAAACAAACAQVAALCACARSWITFLSPERQTSLRPL